MKHNKLMAALLAVVACASCSDKVAATITSETDVGVVISVKYVPETFSTWAKTELETDKGIFVLNGTVSVIKGGSAILREYSDDSQYLCLAGRRVCNHVWGT